MRIRQGFKYIRNFGQRLTQASPFGKQGRVRNNHFNRYGFDPRNTAPIAHIRQTTYSAGTDTPEYTSTPLYGNNPLFYSPYNASQGHTVRGSLLPSISLGMQTGTAMQQGLIASIMPTQELSDHDREEMPPSVRGQLAGLLTLSPNYFRSDTRRVMDYIISTTSQSLIFNSLQPLSTTQGPMTVQDSIVPSSAVGLPHQNDIAYAQNISFSLLLSESQLLEMVQIPGINQSDLKELLKPLQIGRASRQIRLAGTADLTTKRVNISAALVQSPVRAIEDLNTVPSPAIDDAPLFTIQTNINSLISAIDQPERPYVVRYSAENKQAAITATGPLRPSHRPSIFLGSQEQNPSFIVSKIAESLGTILQKLSQRIKSHTDIANNKVNTSIDDSMAGDQIDFQMHFDPVEDPSQSPRLQSSPGRDLVINISESSSRHLSEMNQAPQPNAEAQQPIASEEPQPYRHNADDPSYARIHAPAGSPLGSQNLTPAAKKKSPQHGPGATGALDNLGDVVITSNPRYVGNVEESHDTHETLGDRNLIAYFKDQKEILARIADDKEDISFNEIEGILSYNNVWDGIECSDAEKDLLSKFIPFMIKELSDNDETIPYNERKIPSTRVKALSDNIKIDETKQHVQIDCQSAIHFKLAVLQFATCPYNQNNSIRVTIYDRNSDVIRESIKSACLGLLWSEKEKNIELELILHDGTKYTINRSNAEDLASQDDDAEFSSKLSHLVDPPHPSPC